MREFDIIGEWFAELAKQWVGVPYLHRGCTRKGCDCSGLIVGILKEMGFLEKFKMPVYPMDWNLHSTNPNYLQEYLGQYCYQVEQPEVGDLVVFKFRNCLSHIGIIIDDKIFIHCYQGAGTKYGTLNPGQWSKRVAGYWRIEEDRLNEPA